MMNRLIKEFGLDTRGWRFEWMRRKRTLGLCKYGPKLLLLSTSFVDLNNEDVVDQVCRHEIAHALAGHEAKHGPEWRGIAIQCGVRNPSHCTDAEMAPGRYQANCPSCSKLYSMHRRPKTAHGRSRYCPPCYRSTGNLADALLTFRDTRVADIPRTPVTAPVSAQQSAPAESLQLTPAGASQRFTASQLAAAMGIEAKQFRSWLRKYPEIRRYKVGNGYSFDVPAVKAIVRLWNLDH